MIPICSVIRNLIEQIEQTKYLKNWKKICEINFTVMNSLIWKFDCGYSTERKFSNFPTTLILRETAV